MVLAFPVTPMSKKPVMAAFNQGIIPTIACFNRSTIPLGGGLTLDKLIACMQTYVNLNVAPVWGTPAKLVKTIDMMANAWAMVFLDDADAPGALAYHDLTPDGLPLSKVFVKTTIANGDLVSVSATHELVEMLVDPAINLMSTGPDPKTMYAYESADPCEDVTYLVQGIPVSDFVYPSYFEGFRKPNSVVFDHERKITRPFQILPGGYQLIYKGGRWSSVFASDEKRSRFTEEDRRGHRSEARKTGQLVKADCTMLRKHGLVELAIKEEKNWPLYKPME